jgi:hypothetical protein
MRELRLIPPQVALFGYGSLLSKASMELTLGCEYAGSPVECSIRGWRRTWDVMMPNRTFYEDGQSGELVPAHIIYLNVQKDPHSALNGLAYVLGPKEIAMFDKREWIYNRETITKDVTDLSFIGGELEMYVGKPEFLVPPGCTTEQAAVRRSYIEIVERGLSELGHAFRSEYLSSTDPPPQHLIIDDKKRAGIQGLAGSRESELSK